MFTDEYALDNIAIAQHSVRILRQCCPHRSAPRGCLTSPEVLGVDRRCRFITAPVKNNHPRLSQLLSALICDKKSGVFLVWEVFAKGRPQEWRELVIA
jgi:hypothetical protein